MKKQFKKDKIKKRVEYLLDENNSPFEVVESFRNLMTNISFILPKKEDGRGKVISLSSTLSGEGKTTVAVNLALTYAYSGSKTILIDCDMRKPQVSNYLKQKNSYGMTALLSGQADFESVICRSVFQNLDVIGAGKPSLNPIGLLKGNTLDILLQTLEREYEYVIIDTPPLGTVADGFVVAPKTDGMVVVVRQMKTTHKLLQETIHNLQLSGGKLLGFALNDVDIKRNGYYGKYKYKYKYGYEYTSSERKQ